MTGICAIQEEKGETTAICSVCGKPATVTEYWSISPERPDVQVLKRQTCCTSRARRGKWAAKGQHVCPVVTEILREEAAEGGIALASEVSPVEEPATSSGRGRLSGEERARIVALQKEGLTAEEIAVHVSRSIRVVQKVLDDSGEDHVRVAECRQEIEPEAASKVDSLLELLCEIPEGAMEHLLGLVKLRRQEKQLRQRLMEAICEGCE